MTEIIEVKKKVTFSDLGWGLKTGIIFAWIVGSVWVVSFLIGVVIGLLEMM